MNRKLTITISLLVVLAFAVVGQALAQSQQIGVHVGDRFVYGMTAQWTASDPNAKIPAGLVDANRTAFFNVTVSAVQNPNVTATIAWSFSNGTVVNSTVTVNVDSGEVDYVPGLPIFEGFYYSNLSELEPLRPGGNFIIINQTVSADYASGVRDTNFIQFTFVTSVSNNVTTGTQTTTYYVDKAAGVQVGRIDEAASLDPVTSLLQTASVTWTLKETNLWLVSSSQNSTPSPSLSPSPSIPEFPQTMLVPVAAAMCLIVTVSLAAYRRHSPRNASILR